MLQACLTVVRCIGDDMLQILASRQREQYKNDPQVKQPLQILFRHLLKDLLPNDREPLTGLTKVLSANISQEKK